MAGAGASPRIAVLGQVGAMLDGKPLDLGGRRQRSVLALLVMARGDAVSADRIIDDLWGEDPPSTATGALQAFVSHLRRRLEPGRTARSRGTVIVSTGPGYALQVAPDAVDAWRFEDLLRQAATATDPVGVLTDALSAWHGPAYAEYADEPWAKPEIVRLTELREVAREQLLAARLARGEDAVLVPELERLVAEQPLREERWRLLALGLYRAHRQADALAALRRAREVLADEVGVEPGPALRQLEQEVLHQAPTLDPAPPTTPVVATPPAPRAASPTAADSPRAGRGGARRTVTTEAGVAATPAPAPEAVSGGRVTAPARRPSADAVTDRGGDVDLVDRADEVAELSRCVADLVSGQSQFILVEGPAGIGKTRLLTEARRLATQHDALVLSARGSTFEREYGFGAVRQLFEPVLADPAAAQQLLSGPAAGAAAVFDVASDPAQGTLALMHGLYWLTANLAQRGPVVLSIDDIQWCDSGSLRFFAYLVRRLEGIPVLMIATLRTGEVHEDEALLAELAGDPATVTMRPGPLSRNGVAELVRERLGPDADRAFLEACYRSTLGNPLLLRQMLRALQAEAVRPDAAHARTVTEVGARAISGLVLTRLRRMPEAFTAAARAVAVLGDGAALPSVAALARLAEERAATVVAALARAEVLRDDYPLGFVHPLVADAVYRDLPTGERQLHHERAAQILRAQEAPAERIAAHLMHAPHRGEPWVVEVLRRAATTATGRGAPEAAVRYLSRALEEPPAPQDRVPIMLELAQLETHTNGPAAEQHLREVYDAVTDPAPRARVAIMLARTLVFVGELGASTRFARQAINDLPDHLVDERQGLLAMERVGGYMHDVDPVRWRVGQPEVAGTGPGARMLASALSWEATFEGVDRDRAVALARFSLEDGALFDADPGLLWPVSGASLGMSDEDNMAYFEEALSLAHRRGTPFAALAVHLWRGYFEWQNGDLRAALESVTTSNEQSLSWGENVGIPYADAFLVGIHLDRGDTRRAREYLEEIRPRPRFGDGSRLFGEAEASVLVAEGRYEEALASLHRVRKVLRVTRNPVWRRHDFLRGRALAGLGRGDEAEQLLRTVLDQARVWGANSMTGRVLRTLGELRAGILHRPDVAIGGGDPQGLPELREAVELLAASPARLEHGRALAALATCVSRQEAAALLGDAYRIAHRCGADGLLEQCARGLAQLDVEPPELPTGADLTRMERLLIEIAADGADEIEIAQALLVTPQSVRQRLAALRERTGGRTAAQLRAALAAL